MKKLIVEDPNRRILIYDDDRTTWDKLHEVLKKITKKIGNKTPQKESWIRRLLSRIR